MVVPVLICFLILGIVILFFKYVAPLFGPRETLADRKIIELKELAENSARIAKERKEANQAINETEEQLKEIKNNLQN